MIDVITASPRSLRRKTIAFMAAALLSATAFMVVSPGQASATYGVCGARDFCLHYSYGQSGGLYHGGFVNSVHSYRWVTPATCNRYRTALAPRRG